MDRLHTFTDQEIRDMNRGAALAAVMALVLAGTQSHAQTIIFDGNKLVDLMRQVELAERNTGDADTLRAGTYLGYVWGVADAHSGVSWGCSTKGIVGKQIAEIVSKYINNNPDKWHLQARVLVMNALQQAFPCK